MDLRYQHGLRWLTGLWASIQPSVVTEAINTTMNTDLALGNSSDWDVGRGKQEEVGHKSCLLFFIFIICNYVYVHVSTFTVIMCVCVHVCGSVCVCVFCLFVFVMMGDSEWH